MVFLTLAPRSVPSGIGRLNSWKDKKDAAKRRGKICKVLCRAASTGDTSHSVQHRVDEGTSGLLRAHRKGSSRLSWFFLSQAP